MYCYIGASVDGRLPFWCACFANKVLSLSLSPRFVGRLFQMTAADIANALAPMTSCWLYRHAVSWCRPSAGEVDCLLQRPRCSRLLSTTGQDRGGTWRRSWRSWTIFATGWGLGSQWNSWELVKSLSCTEPDYVLSGFIFSRLLDIHASIRLSQSTNVYFRKLFGSNEKIDFWCVRN